MNEKRHIETEFIDAEEISKRLNFKKGNRVWALSEGRGRPGKIIDVRGKTLNSHDYWVKFEDDESEMGFDDDELRLL